MITKLLDVKLDSFIQHSQNSSVFAISPFYCQTCNPQCLMSRYHVLQSPLNLPPRSPAIIVSAVSFRIAQTSRIDVVACIVRLPASSLSRRLSTVFLTKVPVDVRVLSVGQHFLLMSRQISDSDPFAYAQDRGILSKRAHTQHHLCQGRAGDEFMLMSDNFRGEWNEPLVVLRVFVVMQYVPPWRKEEP